MANAQAWNTGWQTGVDLAAHHRARKEMLSDEERQLKVNDLFAQRDNIAKTLPYLKDDPVALKKAQDALDNVHTTLDQIYHPDRNPGALQKDWHWLSGLVKKHKANAPVLTKTTQPGTPEATVTLPGQRIALPERWVKLIDPTSGAVVPEPQPSTTLATGPQSVTMPATEPYQTVSPKAAALTPEQKQRTARREQAQAETARDVAAAGLSLEQQASAKARAASLEVREAIKNANAIWDEQNPSASEEDRKAAYYENFQRIALGITGNAAVRSAKPDLQNLTLSDGTKTPAQWDTERRVWTYMGGEAIPANLLKGATVETKAAKKLNGGVVPSTNSPTGFARLWVDPYNPDDRSKWAWTPIEATRYDKIIKSESSQVDPFGVITRTTRTTGPASLGNFDLSGVGQAPQGFTGEEAVPAAPVSAPTTSPEIETPLAPARPVPSKVHIAGIATNPDEKAAFAALDGNNPADAEQRFTKLLNTDPSNTRAMVGMGLLRMQQGNFGGAISYLAQAEQKGYKSKEINLALNMARYQYTMGEAQDALKEGKTDIYQQKLNEAHKLLPQSVSAPTTGANGTMVVPNPKGLITPGNLPIWNRPVVQNADGTHSSEYSTSFQDDRGREVIVPTIVDGKFLTPDGKKPPQGSAEEKAMFQAAWQHYLQTGQHLGMFDNAANANAYANVLHNRKPQAAQPPVATQVAPTVSAPTPGQLRAQIPPPPVVTNPSAPVGTYQNPLPLDANGHVPDSDPMNPLVKGMVNRLLDGADIKSLGIQGKDIGAVTAEAQKYGWEQGLFTPKDKLLIREAGSYLKDMRGAPSLKVLESWKSREKIHNALAAETTGNFLPSQIAITFGLNPEEQDFFQKYKQVRGTVSGLTNLTRGGRTTEAGIKRLQSELPDPLTVHSAKDAQMYLDRLLSEIDVAQKKGFIEDVEPGGGGSLVDKIDKLLGGAAPTQNAPAPAGGSQKPVVITDGNKFYRYKGTGAKNDLKNYEEVPNATPVH